jgi:hypothetical protein
MGAYRFLTSWAFQIAVLSAWFKTCAGPDPAEQPAVGLTVMGQEGCWNTQCGVAASSDHRLMFKF